MNLSEIKLVASDMDGTLLNSNHEVSPLFFEIFKELKKYNIQFVAASGRPYYSIIDKLDSIKGDILVAAENGGLVVKNENILLSTPLYKNGLIKIEKQIDRFDYIHAVFCTRSKAYFKKNSEPYSHILSEYYPNYQLINSINEIDEEILKIALYNEDDSEKNIYPLFEQFKTQYKVIVSGKNWVDISDELANKGHALKLIQNLYNITSDETLVFGDYDNDIEMLKQSKFSFAMENANSNIKNIASHETKSNNHYGVELILEKLIEAKKALL
jgi:Cof subfamily protein (haloacid dehalogenase superfamily)